MVWLTLCTSGDGTYRNCTAKLTMSVDGGKADLTATMHVPNSTGGSTSNHVP